jgi:type VI secretion system secreted protein VgrG
MSSMLAGQVLTALSEFSSRTRLYELTVKDINAVLLVEAFAADEQLQGIGVRDVIALSTRSIIAHSSLLGQEACLEISLADGTRQAFSGYISQVATLGSDGGLSRYRLRLSPWIWLLSQVRNSRAWQDSSVVEIIDSVFAQYQVDRMPCRMVRGTRGWPAVQFSLSRYTPLTRDLRRAHYWATRRVRRARHALVVH